MKMRLNFSVLLVLLALGAFSAISSVRAKDVDVTPRFETTENGEKKADGLKWYNTEDWDIEGKAWKETNRYFCRIPASYEEKVPKAIKDLAQNTAGMLVRFRTDADKISVHFKLYSDYLAMPHMPATGVSGLDLYVKKADRWLWTDCTFPTKQESTEDLVAGIGNEMREFLIYFPLYNGLDSLEIGVPEGAEFHAMAPREEKPILYYGTSIAQGGCCSRPGNTFTAMLSRRLDYPILNFGFSGSAHMEAVMAQMFAELDPILYVIDSVPNMKADEIRANGREFVRILREAHPETPILFVDGRRYPNAHIVAQTAKDCDERTEAFRELYEGLVKEGDQNVYFLSSEYLIGDGEAGDYDATMDNSHLNDLGMYRMTNSLERAILPILTRALAK